MKYYTQMSDELSMHLAIGTLLHQVYTFNEPPKIQRRNTAIIVGVLVPFVIYHCVTDEFLLHVILFFIMSWMVAFRIRKLIRETVKDEGHRRQLRRLGKYSKCERYPLPGAPLCYRVVAEPRPRLSESC